jgi:hypothetical protein
LPWRLSTTGTARGAILDSLVVLALVAIILWRYTRSRNLMDVAQDDFVQPKAVRDKFLIALAVLSLSLLFAVTHIQQILSL